MPSFRAVPLAAWLFSTASLVLAQELPKPLVTGLKNPESVAMGADGRIYVGTIGEFDKDGDGAVMVVNGGKATPFATGLDDPKGVVAVPEGLFVADKTRIWRIDRKGKAQTLVASEAFPSPPRFLNDLVVDPESGLLYVSDSGDFSGKGGAVYRVDPKSKRVTLVTDSRRFPGIHTPNGLAMDGASHLLLLDFGTGELHRIKVADGTATKVAEGLGGGDGLVWDKFGRLYTSDWKGGQVFAIPRPGEKPVLLAKGFESAADLAIDPAGKLLVPDMKAGTLTALTADIPGWEVDSRPLPLETQVAFGKLRWTGWKPVDDAGRAVPLRPLLLTHAGDGSKRVFVGIQQGTIHVFPNDDKAADTKAMDTKIFLDISSQVRYSDQENEEGMLGLTFHPKYKTNGEFFVFYTDRRARLTNVVSRFRVSKDDPDRADPASEEVLLRFPKPYWNHDGGTICFGPDGYLYVTHGDGGAANDPFENGQNLKTLLGKVLRIDVDRKQGGKNYAIPKDNPFLGRPGAAPEIWAYGLRNIWRMAFDGQTGRLWAGEVGQNLYEEINLITKGGNYGWNPRESLHPFSPKGVGPRNDMIEPIWEYHHDVGKSITGGLVYRGRRLPDLQGHYLYGDYVTAKIWALKYDDEKKRVVANRPIRDRGLPILSFGEDEAGEAYLMTYSPTGQGIYRFVPTAAKAGQ
jgi:glucose/arabinose dehydrogenase